MDELVRTTATTQVRRALDHLNRGGCYECPLVTDAQKALVSIEEEFAIGRRRNRLLEDEVRRLSDILEDLGPF